MIRIDAMFKMVLKVFVMLLIACKSGLAFASVVIKDVVAQQNGKNVDIAVRMAGAASEVSAVNITFAATNSITHAALQVSNIAQIGEDELCGDSLTRSFVWDAATDLGSVRIDEIELSVTLKRDIGGVQLWEDGPYFAECNVGATKPEEYGYYFWWGDTVGYKRNASNNGWVSVNNDSSFLFDSVNCSTYGKSNSELQSLGYIDTTGNLTQAHDAARAYLGAPWRMPTDAEFLALLNNCDTTWTTLNGVYGRRIMGRGAYSSKSIFLPAAGYGDGSDLYVLGSYGLCWSSSPYSDHSYSAWFLYFGSGYIYRGYDYRYDGQSVRPVRATDGGSDVLLASASTVFSLNNEQTGFIIDSKGVLTGYEGDIPTSIVIPDGVVEISNGVFCYQNITSVKFPNTLKKIGDSAFLNCQLTEVSLPHGIKYIGKAAFKGSNIYKYEESYGTISRVTIENASDLTIAEDAFYGQPVSYVLINGSNIDIGDKAFYQTYDKEGSYRNDLRASIKLTGSGISVGNNAFYNMRFGYYSYGDLTGVKSIGSNAFYAFGNRSAAYLPSRAVKGRATIAFSGELQHLDPSAFSWSGIGRVYVDKESTIYAADGWVGLDAYSEYYHDVRIGVSGEGEGRDPWISDGKDSIYEFKIPSGTRSIPKYAFRCKIVNKIEIPKSVVAIGDEVFSHSQYLKNIVFKGDAPSIGKKVFTGMGNADALTITVYTNAKGWDDDGDGKWNGFTLEFVDPPEQDDWSDVEVDEDSDMYAGEVLGNDHVLAKADLYELKTWANGRYELSSIQANENGLFAFDSSGNPLSKAAEAFLLNCDEDGVEEAKANFKILGMTFAADGLPVFEVNDDAYNGELVFQGSNDLRSWSDLAVRLGDDEEHPASEGYKFFRIQIRLLPPSIIP